MKDLAKELIQKIPSLTQTKSIPMALENTRNNLPFTKLTVRDINISLQNDSETAIVIASGPSLHRQNPVESILNTHYSGTIVCADGALPYCLRHGLIPDFVVTLDPHPTRIVRWFGDPDLNNSDLEQDDYFRRQDLDPHMEEQELERNSELINLLNRNASNIKCIIASCASQKVRNRCIESGMDLYWWNPLYDDIDVSNSITRQVYDMNHCPCLATGGNTGSAAWVFTNTILKKKHIALVGMDFGYAPGTPLSKTQYYKEALDLFGDKVLDAFINIYNPHTKEDWFTDPAYYWYREIMLDMIRDAPSRTYNCTQGGTLFDDDLPFVDLSDFLNYQRI